MRRGSHEVVPFTRCPVLSPPLETFAREVADALAEASLPDADLELYVDALGQRGLMVETGGSALGWDALALGLGVFSHRIRRPGARAPGPQGRLLFEDSSGTPYAFEPGVFVQTNREVNALLVQEALSAAGTGRTFAEVYAGAGNLTVHLARQFRAGEATESDAAAIRMLRHNLRSVRGKVDVREETDTQACARLAAHAPDLVLADPPRSGLKPLYPLFESSPPERAVLVSCHAMAAIRDVEHLVTTCGYALRRIVALDMFPHTDHVELVACLKRPV
jgi:tRNA/tmRNA/rRNA uracil-C5-methylase (TrmA/RlmC/RlmD family)